MVLPQRDPGPPGGQPNPQALTDPAIVTGTRAVRGDMSMIGKGVRVKFPQRAKLFTFPVNPLDIQATFTPRIEATQSLSGVYVDALGKGLGMGQLSGSYGWGIPFQDSGQGLTGLQRMLEFKRLFEEWENETVLRSEPSKAACDIFIDFQQQMYQVAFTGFVISQSQTQPFTVNYNLNYVILYDYNSPVVILPLARLDQAGAPANDGGTPTVQPQGVAQ